MNTGSPRGGDAEVAAVIDLDGVVYRAGRNGSYEVIPGAIESLQRLNQAQIPYVFVTNGTACTEVEKAATVSKLCNISVPTEQIVLASTPMKHLVDQYQTHNVLSVAWSSDMAYSLAKAQGWRNVVSLQDFARAHPILTPAIHRQEENSSSGSTGDDWDDIAAILVYSEPSNWYEGIQILCDIVRRQNALSNRVRIFAGNPDMEYATKHHVPRFTTGAFLYAFQQLYSYSTRTDDVVIEFQGKPYPPIYTEAHTALKTLRPEIKSFSVIYAIGDNPKSDIQGANQAGAPFHSILVETGVYQPSTTNDPGAFPQPRHVCQSIVQAVDYIFLERNHSNRS